MRVELQIFNTADLKFEPATAHLPDELLGYERLWRELQGLKHDDFAEWKAMMRLYSAADLFFLGNFVATTAEVADPFWHRAFFFCEEQLSYSRAMQFDSDHVVDIAARGFGKSTWKTFLYNIQRKLLDPNDCSVIFSHTREAAAKHLSRIGAELRTNELLKTIWDDRFYWNPETESSTWSMKDGYNIKRASSRPETSFSAHAFVSRLPTGIHVDARFYDDIEEEEAVESEEAMANLEEKFISSQDLSAPKCYEGITGTYYHPMGLMRKLELNFERRARVVAGEDLTNKTLPAEEAGPLGGKPYFFHRQYLFDKLKEKGGFGNARARSSYSMQIGCDPLAGEVTTLDKERLRYYDDDPLELGRECTIYVCVDGSQGLGDPTWAWVWGLTASKRYYWLDGFRKRLQPAERKREIYYLCLKWDKVGTLIQLRFEEYGQAEYAASQKEFHDQHNFGVQILRCNDNTSSKRHREFERWQPPLEDAAIWFPRTMESRDEQGKPIDLVQYFISMELGNFPKPATDDGLDAGALIWEPVARAGELVFPAARREREGMTMLGRSSASEGGTHMSAGIL